MILKPAASTAGFFIPGKIIPEFANGNFFFKNPACFYNSSFANGSAYEKDISTLFYTFISLQ